MFHFIRVYLRGHPYEKSNSLIYYLVTFPNSPQLQLVITREGKIDGWVTLMDVFYGVVRDPDYMDGGNLINSWNAYVYGHEWGDDTFELIHSFENPEEFEPFLRMYELI